MHNSHNFASRAVSGSIPCHIDGEVCEMECTRLVFESIRFPCFDGRDCFAMEFYYGLLRDIGIDKCSKLTNNEMEEYAKRFAERKLTNSFAESNLYVAKM